MEAQFQSGSLTLSGYLVQPRRRDGSPLRAPRPAVIFCHGFPVSHASAGRAGLSYHVLADRIAEDMGWTAFVPKYRGCGASEGNFSLKGWRDDICAAARFVTAETPTTGISLAGFGTGAALGLSAAVDLAEVLGVVSVAAPADFSEWEANSQLLLCYCRDVGVIRDEDFPADFGEWSMGLSEISAVISARRVAPRPLLVVHGSADEVVPQTDARAIADAHGSADLRLIAGGSHRLRYDPRCISLVFGWLDRRSYDTAELL